MSSFATIRVMEIVIKKLLNKKFKDQIEFDQFLRKLTNGLKIKPPARWELIESYKKLLKNKKIKFNLNLEKFLTKARVRTSSGVSVITVLTKPYKCPGNCIYCPSEPKMPKSYLSNEPAAQRALRLKFDPIKQIQTRIKALEANGHQIDKIELLVLGGSWTAYSKKYQNNFIKKCFYATNALSSRHPLLSSRSTAGSSRSVKSLKQEQKINEKAKYKIIGLTLETRPDEINLKALKQFRELGCTRAQLGIQHIDNKILKLNKRGHKVEKSIQATKLLKENGFKVDHHYMPDLLGSTPAKDFAMMKKVFTNPNFRPDQIKLYPCVVTKYAEIYKLYKNKKYKPHTKNKLFNLLKNIKKITPYWVRINRLVRDIPADSIIAGNKITNLRQYLNVKCKCKCIRCREVGTRHAVFLSKKGAPALDGRLFIIKYRASGGMEFFISYESADRKILYGFLRLRFNPVKSLCDHGVKPRVPSNRDLCGASKNNNIIFPVLKDSAIIRELHVYGQMLPVNAKLKSASQHKGLGKKLMAQAEKIAKKNNYKKIAVIAGIGVREYYRKLGYKLKNSYMIKKI